MSNKRSKVASSKSSRFPTHEPGGRVSREHVVTSASGLCGPERPATASCAGRLRVWPGAARSQAQQLIYMCAHGARTADGSSRWHKAKVLPVFRWRRIPGCAVEGRIRSWTAEQRCQTTLERGEVEADTRPGGSMRAKMEKICTTCSHSIS